MKLSNKMKIELFALLVILNIILRFQVVSHEIGIDSFLMHIMTNSLSEYGYARWFLHPLSIIGLYPYSYTSSMQFLLSGIHQSAGLDMNSVIFLYCIFLGLSSMLTAYLMAGAIIDDAIFKFLTAFGFSTTPAILGYTTWTITTRGLFIVLAPLLVYLLLKCRTSIRFIPLVFLLAVFLFTTHHLFYFLIPSFFVLFLLILWFKLKEYIKFIKIPARFVPLVLLTIAILMFSIPFFTGKFIEYSRYSPFYINYVRYIGMLVIPAVGGLAYMIFKPDKNFREWFLLLTLIALTTFIYQQTYMKWFLPIFVVPLAGIGLLNVLRTSEKRKFILPAVAVFLLLIVSLSGYYQFINFMPEPGITPINERYIAESTYKTGGWMKENINGSAISNDVLLGIRTFAASETTPLLTSYGIADHIYGFISIDITKFKRYPITEEEFWFSGYTGPPGGELAWESVHRWRSQQAFNITYVVENRKCKGRLHWHHKGNYPQLLQHTYEKDCIYNCGDIYIWSLDNR